MIHGVYEGRVLHVTGKGIGNGSVTYGIHVAGEDAGFLIKIFPGNPVEFLRVPIGLLIFLSGRKDLLRIPLVQGIRQRLLRCQKLNKAIGFITILSVCRVGELFQPHFLHLTGHQADAFLCLIAELDSLLQHLLKVLPLFLCHAAEFSEAFILLENPIILSILISRPYHIPDMPVHGCLYGLNVLIDLESLLPKGLIGGGEMAARKF